MGTYDFLTTSRLDSARCCRQGRQRSRLPDQPVVVRPHGRSAAGRVRAGRLPPACDGPSASSPAPAPSRRPLSTALVVSRRSTAPRSTARPAPAIRDYVNGSFAAKPGDPGCLQKIGCKGPYTKSLCGSTAGIVDAIRAPAARSHWGSTLRVVHRAAPRAPRPGAAPYAGEHRPAVVDASLDGLRIMTIAPSCPACTGRSSSAWPPSGSSRPSATPRRRSRRPARLPRSGGPRTRRRRPTCPDAMTGVTTASPDSSSGAHGRRRLRRTGRGRFHVHPPYGRSSCAPSRPAGSSSSATPCRWRARGMGRVRSGAWTWS